MERKQNKAVFLPPIKRYMHAVERRLRLPFKIKVRVMSDLATTVTVRHEQGESYEAIMADLGSPAEAAADLNEELAEFTCRRSPWRFVFLAAAIAGGVWLLLCALLTRSPLPAGDIAAIGGADGPTSIFVASAPTGPLALFLPPALLLLAGLAGYFLLRRLGGKKPGGRDGK